MAEEYPHLKNAPITEALIDIRTKLPTKLNHDINEHIYNLIKTDYPTKKTIRRFSGEVSFKLKKEETSNEATSNVNEELYGFRYESTDNKQVVQIKNDGLTFSRLTPYIDWNDLRNNAFELWKIYKDILNPELITRVAVRYINNLNISLPIRDFNEYLTAPPTVPESLPQGVSSFLTSVIIHEPSIDANAIITQALESMVSNDKLPVILDIDVFKLNQNGIDEKSAWEILEELHLFKNKIFFNSITKKLMESYQ